jgi:hypothetical protein
MNPLILLAQGEQARGDLDKILDSGVLMLFIPILLIIGGFAVAITKIIVRHRERMVGLPPPEKDDERCEVSFWPFDKKRPPSSS